MTTNPTRYCHSDHPLIKEKAEMVRKETDRATSKAIFTFVRDSVEYNIRRKMKGALRTLKTGNGMCFDKTNLLIALHRSNGIEARYKQLDCKLKVNDATLPAHAPLHLVAEVKLDESWVVLDPSFDQSVDEIIVPSEWGEKTWETINSEKRYDELPLHLPLLINYLIVPFAPSVKTIQHRIDELR